MASHGDSELVRLRFVDLSHSVDSDENVFCDATFSRIVTMNAEQLYKIYTTAKLAHEKEKEKKPKNVDPEVR